MSGDGSELAPSFHVIPQSYGDSLPTASSFLQPGQPCSFNHTSQDYTNHSPYVSSQLNSLAAAHHLDSVYTDPAHQMLMHTNPHFMEQIHANQPLSLPQTIGQLQSIKQEPGLIPGGPPFIKGEPGLIPPAFQESGVIPIGPPIRGPLFINQEPEIISDGLPFIKQEPGLIQRVSRELPLERSSENYSEDYCRNGAFMKTEQGVCKSEAEVDACYYKPVKQEPTHAGVEFGAAFPSQPLDFNFMADIEDIIPSCGEWRELP